MGEVAGGEAVGQTLDVLLPDGDPQPAGAAKRLSRNWVLGRRPGPLPNPSDLPKCPCDGRFGSLGAAGGYYIWLKPEFGDSLSMDWYRTSG